MKLPILAIALPTRTNRVMHGFLPFDADANNACGIGFNRQAIGLLTQITFHERPDTGVARDTIR